MAKDPREAGGSRVLFISGDDNSSKSEVNDVIRTIGFGVIDLGDLANGSKLQQAKGSVATLNLSNYDYRIVYYSINS